MLGKPRIYLFSSTRLIKSIKHEHSYWASTRENLSSVVCEQQWLVGPRSLISAFVIRVLDSIISKLATSESLIFQLASVAEKAGLSLALLETPKTGFVASRPNYYQLSFMNNVLIRMHGYICDWSMFYLHQQTAV